MAESQRRVEAALREVRAGADEVDLSGLDLTEVPPDVFAAVSLERLNLSHNLIERVPIELLRLPSLRYLDFSYNHIATLPTEVAVAQNLQSLNFSNNDLEQVPIEICKLKQLEDLDLGRNRLRTVPLGLGNIPTLRRLELSHNLLGEPLLSLVERGYEAVLAYLKSLLESVPQYESKLLFVGEGGVGKSSLLAALRDEPFIHGRNTTHGVARAKLRMKHPDRETEIQLNCWDFGGQEIYRITHQFFFSRRSLYLVVWKPREGQEENAVFHWLQRIRLRVDDARVLIVATHCRARRPELDYPRLRQEFGEMLAGTVEVDSSDGTGIAELRLRIAQEAAALEHMGRPISKTWAAVRDEAQRLKRPQISRAEFGEIAERYSLDRIASDTLAVLLHDLGHIVYYGDDEGLRDFVVLEPEWLTKAIGYVLEDRRIESNAGVVRHEWLQAIWAEPGNGRPSYDSRFHPYFLRLMERFDICFRIDQTASLIAQMVPWETPSLPWRRGDVNRSGRELSLFCALEAQPPGLIAWLTVRTHRFTTGMHWRYGIFLQHQGHEALIELERNMRLALTTRGRYPDHFFHIIGDTIEHLIEQRWPGLNYRLQVPCRGTFVNGICPGVFDYADLLRWRELGRSTIPCYKCAQEQDIFELTTGFAVPAEPIRSQLTEIERKLEVGIRQQAETAAALRRLLRAVSAENRSSPRLFSIVPTSTAWWRLGQSSFRLRLWCEHPGHEHPVAEPYEFTVPKRWLKAIAPYASLIVKILRLALPLAQSGYWILGDDSRMLKATAEAIQPELDFMDSLATKLKAGTEEDVAEAGLDHTGLTYAEGAGLRELRAFLLKIDPTSKWRGLRRFQTTSADYLWICPEHYREYDPGLPNLPYVSAK